MPEIWVWGKRDVNTLGCIGVELVGWWLRQSAPLFGHCFCDAGIKARSLFPALRSGRHPVDALIAAVDDIGRLQTRQVFQPEAGALCLAMAELPGLNALGKFAVVNDDGLGALMHHGIFDADTLDVS